MKQVHSRLTALAFSIAGVALLLTCAVPELPFYAYSNKGTGEISLDPSSSFSATLGNPVTIKVRYTNPEFLDSVTIVAADSAVPTNIVDTTLKFNRDTLNTSSIALLFNTPGTKNVSIAAYFNIDSIKTIAPFKVIIYPSSAMYSVKIIKSGLGNGTITPAPLNNMLYVGRGDNLTVNFLPDSSSLVDSVFFHNQYQSTAAIDKQFTLTNASSSDSIRVVFAKKKFTFKLEMDSATNANGSVLQNPPNKSLFFYDDTLRLTAAAKTGFYFGGWDGDVITSDTAAKSITITFRKNMIVSPKFTKVGSVTLTVGQIHGKVTQSPPDANGYAVGQKVLLTAIPDTGGWVFDSWSDDVPANSKKDTITITMTTSKKVTANFIPQTFALTVVGLPQAGGTISAPATSPVQVGYNTPYTITAVPAAAAGYKFFKWDIANQGLTAPVIGNDALASTTVRLTSGPVTLRAQFIMQDFQLSVSSMAGGSILLPLAPTTKRVNYGAATSIKTKADIGYTFLGWTGTGNPAFANRLADSTTVVLTTADADVKANFQVKQFVLTVTAAAGGTIISPTTATVPITYFDSTAIGAMPPSGATFLRWASTKGNAIFKDSTKATTWVKLQSGDDTVKAYFSSNAYAVTIGTYDVNAGTITKSPEKASYAYGDTILFTAVPKTGYVFSGWGSAIAGNSLSAKDTVYGDIQIAPLFTKIGALALTVTAQNGAVTINPDSTGLGGYHFGTVVTLTAADNDSFNFSSWLGATPSTSDPKKATITMDAAKFVTANFVRKTYTLTIQQTPTGSGTVTPIGNVTVGHNVKLDVSAVKAAGYVFTKWTRVSGAGTVVFDDSSSSGGTTKVTVKGGDAVVQAVFTKIQYHLTINSLNGSSNSKVTLNINGTPTTALDFDSGTVVTMVPSPASNYRFVSWSGDPLFAATPAQIKMDGGKIINANFVRQYPITCSSTGPGTVSAAVGAAQINTGDLVDSASTVIFTATKNTTGTVAFKGWGGDASGTSLTKSFTNLNSAKNVTAEFVQQYQLVWTTAGSSGTVSAKEVLSNATVTNNQWINAGTNIALAISSSAHCHITSLFDGTTSIASAVGQQNYSYSINGLASNHNIAVTFGIDSCKVIASVSGGVNGTISPSGNVFVPYNGSQIFSMIPSVGYEISDIKLGNNSIGKNSPYTATSIQADQTITVWFSQIFDTIVITQPSTGGSIDIGGVSGKIPVAYGSNPTITFTPNRYYHLSSITDNGAVTSVTTSGQYSYTILGGIKSNHAISAVFEMDNYRTVTFNWNTPGPAAPATVQKKVTYNSTISSSIIPTPTLANCTPSGWFVDPQCRYPWYFSTKLTSDTTLYAKWVVMDADRNYYETVTIGNMMWMKTNLKTTVLNNNTPIPNVINGWVYLNTPGYCKYEDTRSTVLYNWYAVDSKLLAPVGWHVATLAEWESLVAATGNTDLEVSNNLRDTASTGSCIWMSPNAGAKDAYGFAALPEGYRAGMYSDYSNLYDSWGTAAYFWSSSTIDPNMASSFNIRYYYLNSESTASSGIVSVDKTQGSSVRCVRDYP